VRTLRSVSTLPACPLTTITGSRRTRIPGQQQGFPKGRMWSGFCWFMRANLTIGISQIALSDEIFYAQHLETQKISTLIPFPFSLLS
jgi:hypothetical protein